MAFVVLGNVYGSESTEVGSAPAGEPTKTAEVMAGAED